MASSKLKVVLLADGTRDPLRSELERLRPVVDQAFEVVGVVFDLAGGTMPAADLAIVFGGDGSIL